MITYGNWLLDQGNTTYVNKTLWPIVQLDLNYVANNWNKSTYVLVYSFLDWHLMTR